MKLLSIALAKSSWLGNTNDFNPEGRYLLQEILPFVLELYKFKKYPSPDNHSSESKEEIFEDGEFKNDKGHIINIRLTVTAYGLVAESRSSTIDTDAFLESLLSRLSKTFNLPDHKEIFKTKQYVSQVYFNTDKSLDIINPKLKEISNYLSKAVVGYGETSYQLGGLSFWTDQTQPFNPLPFSIERASTIPFSENRFISTCSLQTNDHLDLLKVLEDILG